MIPILLLLLGFGTASASAPITFAADPWCPITCSTEKNPKGILFEVVHAVFDGKHDVKLHEYSWTRVLEEVRSGKITAAVGALKSDAPDFVFPKTSVINQKSCFYALKGNAWKYSGPKSLASKRIGVTANYTYGEPFDTHLKEKHDFFPEVVSGENTFSKLVEMLKAKRVDLIVDDENVANYFFRGKPAEIESRGCLKGNPLFVAFSPKLKESKELAREFDEAVKKLSADGTIRKIKDSYR